jgi:hypothetical protein
MEREEKMSVQPCESGTPGAVGSGEVNPTETSYPELLSALKAIQTLGEVHLYTCKDCSAHEFWTKIPNLKIEWSSKPYCAAYCEPSSKPGSWQLKFDPPARGTTYGFLQPRDAIYAVSSIGRFDEKRTPVRKKTDDDFIYNNAQFYHQCNKQESDPRKAEFNELKSGGGKK